jgi:hypothetical protein
MAFNDDRDAMTVPLQAVDHESLRVRRESDADANTPRSYPTDGHSRSSIFFRWHIYTDVKYIVESSWLTPNQWLCFKLFCWAWTSSIWLMTCDIFGKRFPIFLTNWNHTSIFIYFNLSCYICVRNYIARAKSTDLEAAGQQGQSSYVPNTRLLRFTYGMMEHSFAWTCLVVVVYWSTEFPNWVHTDPTAMDKFTNACIHAVTFLLITTDLLLNRIEFVWPHLVYTMTISIVYLMVNGIYCRIAGGFIYQILRWNGFMTAVAVVGASLFVSAMYPLGHLICGWRNRKSGHVAPEASLKWCVMRR